MTRTRTIAFFPEPGAWGPTNNCAAMAGVLRERGHRVVFVVDESFAGVLEARGFEERLFRMAPPEDGADGLEEDDDVVPELAQLPDRLRRCGHPRLARSLGHDPDQHAHSSRPPPRRGGPLGSCRRGVRPAVGQVTVSG